MNSARKTPLAEPGSLSPSTTPQVVRIRALYRRFAPVYDAFRAFWSWWTRPIEDELDRLFRERIDAQTPILELAPGTGINIERVFRRSPGFESYLGIDASPEMLARAAPRTRGDARIELRQGDVTDLKGLGSGPFDFVVSTWLLSHLDAPAATVRDALGHVAPGGTAVFVFFTVPRWGLLRALLRALSGPFSYRLVDPEPIRALPGLERTSSCAAGMATIAVFRGESVAARAP